MLATALMLLAMRERSFLVATTLTKTEPVQIVALGVLFLDTQPTPALFAAALLATLGVLVVALPGAGALAKGGSSKRAIFYGLASASAFGASTLGFRAGMLAIETPAFVMAAAEATALGLSLQTLCILVWLGAFDRAGLAAIAREWRGSLTAGFTGAAATILWFFALALESAARVRTLGLVEVIFANLVSRRMFAKGATLREWLGVAMIAAGVALALNG